MGGSFHPKPLYPGPPLITRGVCLQEFFMGFIAIGNFFFFKYMDILVWFESFKNSALQIDLSEYWDFQKF